MSVTYKYTDKSSNREINSDNIVSDNDNGILEYIGNSSFRFIPKENVLKEVINADSGYDEIKMPTFPEKANPLEFDQTSSVNKNKNLGLYYNYIFGIDELSIQRVKSDDVSGFISTEIEIGSCSYLELSVKESETSDSNIEYYIMDGMNEYSILPVDKTEVVKEKLFFNLPTRFQVDQSQDVKIYKNNELISLTYTDIGNINFNDNDVYTISYKPLGECHKVFPQNKKIKVKVIYRHLSQTDRQTAIESMVVLKYGGDKQWIM